MASKWIGKDDRAGEFGFQIDRDLLCTVNAAGYFTSLNSGRGRVLGWTRDELMSRPLTDFIHPADRERTVGKLAKVTLRDYQVANFENQLPGAGR